MMLSVFQIVIAFESAEPPLRHHREAIRESLNSDGQCTMLQVCLLGVIR